MSISSDEFARGLRAHRDAEDAAATARLAALAERAQKMAAVQGYLAAFIQHLSSMGINPIPIMQKHGLAEREMPTTDREALWQPNPDGGSSARLHPYLLWTQVGEGYLLTYREKIRENDYSVRHEGYEGTYVSIGDLLVHTGLPQTRHLTHGPRILGLGKTVTGFFEPLVDNFKTEQDLAFDRHVLEERTLGLDGRVEDLVYAAVGRYEAGGDMRHLMWPNER